MTPFPTVVDALLHRARTTPDARGYTFLADGDHESDARTWAGLAGRAGAVAALLAGTTAPGDRVLLAFDEGLALLDALFGCWLAGRVAVPVHAPDAAREARTTPRLVGVAADCGAAVALTDPHLVEVVVRALPAVPVAALPPGAAEPPPPPPPGALAMLQYTSGSTAEPKGVCLTHAHLAHQLADFDAGYDHVAGDVSVSWLPATHDLGLVYGRLMAVWTGMHAVGFPPAAFVQRPSRWLRALSRWRATHSCAPDFAFALVARRSTPEELAGVDLSAVKVLVDGAEPIRPESDAAFLALATPLLLRPSALTHALGMSEATAKVASEPATRAPARFVWLDRAAYEQGRVVEVPPGTPGARPVASNGFPGSDTRVLAVDPESRGVLGEDRVGELWVAGSTVAAGYWGRPALTAEVFGAVTAGGEGPFLRTGDLGFVRGGEVYVSGRRKDLVVVRGQNHHPADLERLLEPAHGALRPGGVVVVGVEGPDGEGVGVVAEVQPGADLPGVVAALRAALGEEGLSAAVVALLPPRSLPKTSSGKHARAETARRLAARELPELLRAEAPAEARAVAPSPLRAEVSAAPARRRVAVLERHVLGLAAARLGVDAAALDPDRPFQELGLDSVAGVELVEDAARALGVEVRGTALFDHPTPAALAAHLLGLMDAPGR